MNYSVVWYRGAEDELADIWLAADSALRQEITTAAHRLEWAMRSNPLALGESREGTDRVAFDDPLGVLFEVSNDDRLVKVREIWRIR